MDRCDPRRARRRSEAHLVSSPTPDGPLIDSPDAAARALCDYFLANAYRGDNAVNYDLVAEVVRRIRIRQATSTTISSVTVSSWPPN